MSRCMYLKQQHFHHIWHIPSHKMLHVIWFERWFKLPELTGQSLVLLCQVSRQLACLNILYDSDGVSWSQMELGGVLPTDMDAWMHGLHVWSDIYVNVVFKCGFDLSFNQPCIALSALQCCPVERSDLETNETSMGRVQWLWWTLIKGVCNPPPHPPQSSSISSEFKQPLLLLVLHLLESQPQLVTLLLQHLQPAPYQRCHIIILSDHHHIWYIMMSGSYQWWPRSHASAKQHSLY